jgi:hypothetical protein
MKLSFLAKPLTYITLLTILCSCVGDIKDPGENIGNLYPNNSTITALNDLQNAIIKEANKKGISLTLSSGYTNPWDHAYIGKDNKKQIYFIQFKTSDQSINFYKIINIANTTTKGKDSVGVERFIVKSDKFHKLVLDCDCAYMRSTPTSSGGPRVRPQYTIIEPGSSGLFSDKPKKVYEVLPLD